MEYVKKEVEIDLTTVVQLLNKNPTKRGILSTLVSVFDPLGLVRSVNVSGKMIFKWYV